MADPIDRLTFWRGWWTGARHYPDAQRLAVYDAILAFAFDGTEPPQPDGTDLTANIVFDKIEQIRPTIEISRKRRQFGSLGGKQTNREPNAKPTASHTEATRKQTASKPQAKPKQSRKPRKQVKEQEQVQDQEQEHNANSCLAPARKQPSPPSLDQFLAGAVLAGVPDDFARRLYADLVAFDWRDADGRHVGNWRRYLRHAFRDEKNSAPRVTASAAPSLADFKIGR